MFKVLIIDDEPIVRKGIVNIINWKALGCEVVDEASNGLEGIEKIKQHLPDIILTDINMPEVDGLEMIKQTLDLIPWSKIIILTGFREFDYIQEALKLGASEYLLKPSKIDEITTAIKKACLELEYQNKRDENLKALEEHFNKSIPILKEKLLHDMMFATNLNEEELEEEMSLYNIEIDGYIVVSVDLVHKSEVDIYQKQLYKIGIKNAFLDIFSDQFKCESINITQSRLIFIIQPKTLAHDFETDIHKKAESFQVMIKSCFDIDMTLGVSTVGHGWTTINSKMKECEQALKYKVYFGEDALILYDDIKNLSLVEDDYSILELTKDIASAIKIGNENLLGEMNKKLFDYMTHMNDYKKVYEDLISDLEEKPRIEINLEGENLHDIHMAYVSRAEELLKKNKDHNIKNLSMVLKQSLEYIHENYQESISLQDVADYTFVSIYYLSRMFKKELGKNFVDYLGEYRIEKAKHYLKDYELKTYEVAELVGISDPHYFSKIFKKYAGETPTEFRSKQ